MHNKLEAWNRLRGLIQVQVRDICKSGGCYKMTQCANDQACRGMPNDSWIITTLIYFTIVRVLNVTSWESMIIFFY